MHDQEELFRQKELLKETQALARVGSFEWDIRTGQLNWSEQLYKIFGVDARTFHPSFEAYLQMVHPEDVEQVKRRVMAAVSGASSFETQSRIMRPDGSSCVLQSHGRILSDAFGQPEKLIGACMDITEFSLTIDRLNTSEARYRAMVDHASDGLVLHDEDGVIVDVNTRVCTQLGYSREELIGQTPLLYNREMTREQLAEIVERLHDAEFLTFEAYHAGKDGHLFPVEVRLRSYLENGQRRAVSLVLDISQRRQAEAARLASEQRLRLLLHSANLVVWEADPITLNFTYVSDYCERLLGYARQAWLAPNFWLNHLHPDDRDEAYEICRHGCEAGIDHRMEYRMIDATGAVVWIEDAVHVQVQDGRVVLLQGVLQNISQRKLLEEQLHQSQKMEAIGRLAGGVAHDFNNILTVMMGYSELLLFTMPANDPGRAAIASINEAGKRAAALTRQLLTFSRKAIVAPKVLDLNDLVRSTEALLRPTIGEDIKLTIDIDPDVRPIKADRVHIEQVLMNLAINARDAMPQGGSMRISTSNRARVPNDSLRALSDYVELALTDSGCGISDEVIGKIFDPFFTTKEVGRGTGLGLAVVHGVVTGAGGFIHVDSQLGIGTTFHLCFPAAPSGSQVTSPSQESDYPRGQETILLVEDDRAVRAVTQATLTQLGYQVVDAGGGDQALGEFRRDPRRFDLLLTDVVMPGMSGRKLAETIREIRPELPVLFMSGHTDDAVVQHGIRSSADAFIQKPFHPQSLGHKLRELLKGQ